MNSQQLPEHIQKEYERFSRRIVLMTDEELKSDLRRYRRQINHFDAIRERGARYEIRQSADGSPLKGNRRYRAMDEMTILHKWLDNNNVPDGYDITTADYAVAEQTQANFEDAPSKQRRHSAGHKKSERKPTHRPKRRRDEDEDVDWRGYR